MIKYTVFGEWRFSVIFKDDVFGYEHVFNNTHLSASVWNMGDALVDEGPRWVAAHFLAEDEELPLSRWPESRETFDELGLSVACHAGQTDYFPLAERD